MEPRRTGALLAALLLLLLLGQSCEAGVTFRLSFGFGLGDATATGLSASFGLGQDEKQTEVSESESGKQEEIDNHIDHGAKDEGHGEDAEEVGGPGLTEATLRRIDAVAERRLPTARRALFEVNRELLPLVGRSDPLVARLKLINRFLVQATEALDPNNAERLAKTRALDAFLRCVEQLEQPAERSVEQVLVRLLLEKHGVLAERRRVREELAELVDVDVESATEAATPAGFE